ncbi:MAG: hypothetical protein Q7U75_07050, partial [Desulfobacterales bacterium]|nr:hypothetical protein [Desulfobacterales bacterium]
VNIDCSLMSSPPGDSHGHAGNEQATSLEFPGLFSLVWYRHPRLMQHRAACVPLHVWYTEERAEGYADRQVDRPTGTGSKEPLARERIVRASAR